MKTNVTEQTQKIMELIIERMQMTLNASYLEFYGNGEMYEQVKQKTSVAVLSINNNPSKNKKIKGETDIYLGDIQTFCEDNKFKKKFNVIWLNYQQKSLNLSVIEDIKSLPPVMAESGTLFITLLPEKENYPIDMTIYSLYHFLAEEGVKLKVEYIIKDLKYIKQDGKEKLIPMKVYGFIWEKIENEIKDIPLIPKMIKTLASNL